MEVNQDISNENIFFHANFFLNVPLRKGPFTNYVMRAGGVGGPGEHYVCILYKELKHFLYKTLHYDLSAGGVGGLESRISALRNL